MQSRPRMIEWHCGIGGVSAAVGDRFEILAAIDIKREAADVYSNNFPRHQIVIKNIDSISDSVVAGWGSADIWWMSPPCQPHTVLGKRMDMADPRSASFARMLQLIDRFRPNFLAMENVPGFGESISRNLLIQTLEKTGYSYREETLCPTQFGWPNRRNRYYLVASRNPINLFKSADVSFIRKSSLNDFISIQEDDNLELHLEQEFIIRYGRAIHLADRFLPHEMTNCFTSAYGRSATRCGSYLRISSNEKLLRARRFSPREVLNLLDFPQEYQLPGDLSPKKLWPMVGNSLTLGVVKYILSQLPIW